MLHELQNVTFPILTLCFVAGSNYTEHSILVFIPGVEILGKDMYLAMMVPIGMTVVFLLFFIVLICEGTPIRQNDEPLVGQCWFCSGFWQNG